MGFDELVSVGGLDGGCVVEEGKREAENRRPGPVLGEGGDESGFGGEGLRVRSPPPRLPELKLADLGIGGVGTGFGGDEMFRGIR